MNFIVENLDGWELVASELLEHVQPPVIITLTGDMGVGKTSLVQAICRALGISQPVLSPTFSLINEYSLTHQGKDCRLAHIDLFRLQNIQQAIDIGIEDYLYDVDYCMIEWPKLIEPLLPPHVWKITIETLTHDVRKVVILQDGAQPFSM